MVYDWCSLCGIEIGTPKTYVPTYEGKIVPIFQEHAMSPICELCNDELRAGFRREKMSRYIIGKKNKEEKLESVVAVPSSPFCPFDTSKIYIFKTKELAETIRKKEKKTGFKVMDSIELGIVSEEELNYEIDEDNFVIINKMEDWENRPSNIFIRTPSKTHMS